MKHGSVTPAGPVSHRWQVAAEQPVLDPEDKGTVLLDADAETAGFERRPLLPGDGVGNGVGAGVPGDADEVGRKPTHVELGVLEAGAAMRWVGLELQHPTRSDAARAPVRRRRCVAPVPPRLLRRVHDGLKRLAKPDDLDAVDGLSELPRLLPLLPRAEAGEDLRRLPLRHVALRTSDCSAVPTVPSRSASSDRVRP